MRYCRQQCAMSSTLILLISTSLHIDTTSRRQDRERHIGITHHQQLLQAVFHMERSNHNPKQRYYIHDDLCHGLSATQQGMSLHSSLGSIRRGSTWVRSWQFYISAHGCVMVMACRDSVRSCQDVQDLQGTIDRIGLIRCPI